MPLDGGRLQPSNADLQFLVAESSKSAKLQTKTVDVKAEPSKVETPPTSTPESSETDKDRESNAKVLQEYGNLLTNQYDATLSKAVTSTLIAAGYEGTPESRTTKSNIPNIEDIKSQMESRGMAIACVSEIIDPDFTKDAEAFTTEMSSLTPEEVQRRGLDLNSRQNLLYRAIRGNDTDLQDPKVQAARSRIDELKKLPNFEEIVKLIEKPEAQAAYEEWKKDHKSLRPENLDEEIFKDFASQIASGIEKTGILKHVKQEESVLKTDIKEVESLKSLSAALVSVYGDVGGTRVKTDIFGKDVEYEAEAREAIEVGVERTAALAETENQAKWGGKRKEGQSWISRAGEVVKNNLDRGWRAMFSDKLHHAKEIRHGLRMMAQAGVETGLTSEFVTQVDAEARKIIEKSREKLSKFGRLKAATKDFFSEVVGHERQLHAVKEEVIKGWRKKFDANPFDAKDNPIYDLVMSDMQSRTEIARRVSESTQESLHLSGESKSKKSIKIESGSEYGKFLNENIFKVVVKEALDRKKAGETNITGVSADLRVKLDKQLNDFYQTEDFKKWKDSLSKADQELLPDSFTYATDVIAQVEGSLIPNALELSDYYDKARKLEIDLDLTIGTAQYGPNGEISPDGIGRLRLKKEVLARMHEKSAVFARGDIDGGIKRAMFIASADEIVNNPLGAAILGFVGGRMIMTTAKAAGGAVGVGVFGGVKAGFREWAKLGTELKQVDIEKALGMHRAEDAKKYHKLEAFTNKSVIMSEHASNIDEAIGKLGESVTAEGITKLMSHIVNGEARVSLGVKHRINLIGAKSVGGGESAERQNYQLERRKFDLAQAKARVELKKVAESTPEVWETIRKELGFRKGTSVDKILQDLRLTQEDNLLGGASIPQGYESVLGTITLEAQDSIKGRAKAFKTFRARSAVTQGAIVGVTAGLMTWGLSEYAENHDQVIKTSVENIKSVVVSPDTPLHPDGLPNGVGNMNGIAIHARLPEGMSLKPIEGPSLDGHHSFNIFVDGQEKPLVTGVGFDRDGMPSLTDAARAQLSAHGITLTPQPLASHALGTLASTPEIGQPLEHMDIRMGDLPGRGEGGIWDWMMNSVRGQNNDVGINTQTNGAYKLFRAYENMRGNDNFVIQEEPGIPHRVIHTVTTNWHGQEMQEVLPAVNPDNMIIKDLPPLFATPEGHQKIADVVAEAVRDHDAGKTLDRFHQLVYTAAVSGEGGIPNAEDTAFIMQQFDAISAPPVGELVSPHEIFIEISKPIVEEVACGVKREVVDGFGTAFPLIIDWHRPLEAAEGAKAPSVETYESTKGPGPTVTPIETAPLGGDKGKDKKEKIEKEPVINESNESKIELPKTEVKENKVVQELEYKGVKIRIVEGDIRNAKTDAIVSPSNSTLTLASGMVENAIADKMGRSNYIRNAKIAKEYLAKIAVGGAQGEIARKEYIDTTSRESTKLTQPFISANDALESSLQVWDDKEHHEEGDLRFGASIAMPSAGALADKNIKAIVLTNARPEHHIKNLSEADVAHMTGSASRAANVIGATSITIPALGTGTGSDSGFGLSEERSVEGFLAGAINYIDTMAAVEVVPIRDAEGNFIPIYGEDGKEIRAVESTTKPVEGHKPMERIEFMIYAQPNESNIEKIKAIIDKSEAVKQIKKSKTGERPDHEKGGTGIVPEGGKEDSKQKNKKREENIVEEKTPGSRSKVKPIVENKSELKGKNPKLVVSGEKNKKKTKLSETPLEGKGENGNKEELKSKKVGKESEKKDNNGEPPVINPEIEIPLEEHKKIKRNLKKNITVVDNQEDHNKNPDREKSRLEVENEIRTHMLENQSLADFAALEYGAIARTLNKLSNEEVNTIIKSMENRPDLQAVYRAAMIGLRVLPQDFKYNKDRYEARIEGTNKRISQLEQSIEKESKRRLVSIFEPNFATEFNGSITWEKAKSLDELPDFAQGTLVLPENVTVDKDKIKVIADAALVELRDMNDAENGVDVENLRPLREEIHKLEEDAVAEGVLKISKDGKRERKIRSGNRKSGDKAMLRKIDDKVKLLGKIEDKWEQYNSILNYIDDDSNSVRSRTIPLSTYKKRVNNVVLETNLSKSTQQLLEAFTLDGNPISLEYILDNNTNISWRTGSGKLISNGRGIVTFEENGQTVSGTIEFDEDGNPTDTTKTFLKEHKFWDEDHEYRAVTPAYPGEIINYSQAVVDKLKTEVDNQKEIARQYQTLINAIGDMNTEGTFAYKISTATKLVNTALDKKISRLLEFIKSDPEYSAKYPVITGAFGNENLSKFVKDTDRISTEDLLLGAILLANKELRKKLPSQTAQKITDLQDQVNIDDLAILEYARSVDKPVNLRDDNRAQVYVEDFTRGDAIKYVLQAKGEEFRRIGEALPYNPATVAKLAKNYTF